MKGFGSDNHSGVHPELLKAIQSCNIDHEPSYGTDQYSKESFKTIHKLISKDIDIHYVFNGTASNVLSLAAGIKRYQSVLVSDVSHMDHDECGAPEFFAGKTIRLPTKNGKIIINEIENYLVRKGDQHFCQPKMISITQPTELGTCYSLDEIQEISKIAKKHELYFHIDGARLCNALYFLKSDFKQMLLEKHIDIVSLGGTKNGFLFGEAILILNPALKNDFKYIKKQFAQLPSKSRFIAHQFQAYFTNQLYIKIAKHSVDMASYLYAQLLKISLSKPELILTQPQESNAVFIILPKTIIKPLREKYFFYVWNEKIFECRLMTSWDTTQFEIDDFIQNLKQLL